MNRLPNTAAVQDESTCISESSFSNGAGTRDTIRNLYLDLLKGVLTDTVFGPGPDPDTLSPAHYVQSVVKHCIEGNALTMVPTSRLNNIQQCIEDVINNDVPGDVIEAGVWRGGTAIFMRAVLKACGSTSRRVWVADSFEGLPMPDAGLHPVEAKAHESKLMRDVYHHFAVEIDEVRRNFCRFGLFDEQVQFLKGWFKDTLSTAPIKQLAVIRLDSDYYESTMDCLVNLYQRLSIGGYLVVDDYGQDDWTYCRKAVDEFRLAKQITDPLVKVDSTCYFWQRTG